MRQKVLLFDFDGTIADSFENFLEIQDKLSVKYNFPSLPRDELEKFRSDDPRKLIKYLKIPFYKIPFMARDMKKMQQESITQIEPYTGLPEVLNKLKRKGYVLGIITSNGKENVKQFLKKHTMIELFSYLYSDSSIFGKDKIIGKFLKQNAINNDDVWYIGDEIRDIQACKKVGVKIIAVSWGFNSKEGLINYNPDFLIDKPEDLLTIVE